jgi:hypothetical protein
VRSNLILDQLGSGLCPSRNRKHSEYSLEGGDGECGRECRPMHREAQEDKERREPYCPRPSNDPTQYEQEDLGLTLEQHQERTRPLRNPKVEAKKEGNGRGRKERLLRDDRLRSRKSFSLVDSDSLKPLAHSPSARRLLCNLFRPTPTYRIQMCGVSLITSFNPFEMEIATLPKELNRAESRIWLSSTRLLPTAAASVRR